MPKVGEKAQTRATAAELQQLVKHGIGSKANRQPRTGGRK